MLVRSIVTAIVFACLHIPALSFAENKPYLSFSSSPTTNTSGGTTLSWASSAATACVASGDWGGSKLLAGTLQTPSFTELRNYVYQLECTNAHGSVSKKLTIQSDTETLFDSPWATEPTVVPHRPEFSLNTLRWRIKFRLDSIGTEQGLISLDESGQKKAGHTTVSVDSEGYVTVRHQAKKKGSYATRSKSRVLAGQDHELLLEIRKDSGTELWLDGKLEGMSEHGFGTADLRRSLILGASCAHCKRGSAKPLSNPIRGGVSFSVEKLASNPTPSSDKPIVATKRISAPNRQALFESGEVNQPSVFEHRTEFARSSALWRLQFKLNNVGNKQTLVSYDEKGQLTAGHTSISVLPNGTIQVRHQDGGTESYYLNSKTLVQPGKAYTVLLRNVASDALELYVNGIREARTTIAFGTVSTTRPMVIGGSCESCKAGKTQPIENVVEGKLSLEIFGDWKADLVTDPEYTEQDLLFQSNTLFAATKVDYQPAFAMDNSIWSTRFRLNSTGKRQGLFSYDEKGQKTSGHTTLEVLSNGRIAVRHQDFGNVSEILASKTLVRPGKEYLVSIAILANDGISLIVNGMEEDRSDRAFGTLGTRRDLIIGASCSYCRPGATSPLRYPIDGEVMLEIRGKVASLLSQEEVEVVLEQKPEVLPPATEVETELVFVAPIALPTNIYAPEPESEPEPALEPSLAFDASDTSVLVGENVTLAWQATNVSSCVGSGDWTGELPIAGSRTRIASNTQRNFTLSCAGAGGSVLGIVSLSVNNDVVINWTPPKKRSDGSELTNLAGYSIYYGNESGVYTDRLVVADPLATGATLALVPGTYYFVISAIDESSNESGFSPELVELVQ